MMGLEEVAVPALSAAGGGLTVGWIAKVMIQRFLKGHDDLTAEVRSMLIQLTRMEEQLKTLQRGEQTIREQDRALAVMAKEIEEFRQDLNGLGRKVREITQ